MKMLWSFLLLLCFSCASKPDLSPSLEQRIAEEEVRSLNEIKQHSQILLESHPEIEGSSRETLSMKINEVIKQQQALRDEESKIIQALICKTLDQSDVNPYKEVKRKELEKKLKINYQEKYKNIFSLASMISEMSLKNQTSEQFDRDISLFMREIK